MCLVGETLTKFKIKAESNDGHGLDINITTYPSELEKDFHECLFEKGWEQYGYKIIRKEETNEII